MGGSLVRTEATGYGLCYFMEEAMKTIKGKSLKVRQLLSQVRAMWPFMQRKKLSSLVLK